MYFIGLGVLSIPSLNDEGFTIDSDDQCSVQPLINTWDALKVYNQHNGSALFTLGAVSINMNLQTLVELKNGAPIVVLYGDSSWW